MKKLIFLIAMVLTMFAPIRASAMENDKCDHNWVKTSDHNMRLTPATCDKDGLICFYCEKCDLYDIQEEKAHHNFNRIDSQPANCNSYGYVTTTCSRCGETHLLETTLPLHEVKNNLSCETYPAGWFTQGERLYRCPECKEVIHSYTIPSYWEVSSDFRVYCIVLAILVVAIVLLLIIATKDEVNKKKEENWYEKDIFNGGDCSHTDIS